MSAILGAILGAILDIGCGIRAHIRYEALAEKRSTLHSNSVLP